MQCIPEDFLVPRNQIRHKHAFLEWAEMVQVDCWREAVQWQGD